MLCGITYRISPVQWSRDRLAHKLVNGYFDKLDIMNSNENIDWKVKIAEDCQFYVLSTLYLDIIV
jgi:hypothetical protein